MALIMFVHLDRFYAAAAGNIYPDLHQQPFVIVEAGSRGRIIDISSQARSITLSPGLSRAQIQQLYPDIRIIDFHPEDYEPFAENDREFFYSLTPLVEPAGLNSTFLDISGTAGPEELIKAILSREDEYGRIPFIGIARNKPLAQIVSRYLYIKQEEKTAKILTDEKAFLNCVPISCIPFLSEKNCRELIRLGIKTIADLMQLPHSRLARQLNQPGLAHRLLSITGKHAGDTVVPAYPPERICTTRSFDEGIANTLHAQAVLSRMCQHIARELKNRHRQCQNLRLTITSAGGCRTISQYLHEPAADPDVLTSISFNLMRKIPYQKPVNSFQLQALDLHPASYQQTHLFTKGTRRRPDPGHLQKAMAAVQKRCGIEVMKPGSELQPPRRDLMLMTLRSQHLC